MIEQELRVTVKVELDGPELTDSDSDTLLAAFIEELTGILEEIPEEHRSSAMIRCHYDSCGYTYIKYERPETEEEKEGRLVREARSRTENEKRDREQLARLKARYEQ